ncbi:MAG: hypothetical protein PHI19_03550 [Clostridia bacterium]|nr:hypothetical protein [Clostridia bacterium]
MKKLIVLVVLVALIALSAVAMLGCTENEETVKIEKIEAVVADNTVFHVGDAFDASKFEITATLSDETEVEMTNTAGVFYDKSELQLNNNKYSEEGTFTLKIIYLDKYEAEVEITVHEEA